MDESFEESFTTSGGPSQNGSMPGTTVDDPIVLASDTDISYARAAIASLKGT